MVEFALVVPLLLLLVMVTADFGRVYLGWVNLQNMARIAANYAANNPTSWNNATYQNLVTNDAQASNCALTGGVPSPTFSSTAVGGTVTVSITCTFHPITPVISNIVGSGISVSASSVFPVKSGILAAGSGCPLPTAAFSTQVLVPLPPLPPQPPLTVQFTADTSSSAGSPYVFSWNFGDATNNSSTASTDQHVYDNEGAYTVTLSAGNACGFTTNTQTDLILVTKLGFCLPPNFIGTSKADAPALWASRGCTGTISYSKGGTWPIAGQSLPADQSTAANTPILLSK